MSNLAQLRSQLLDQVDTDPAPSTDFVRRVNSFINRAYTQVLPKDLPFLFFEEEVRFSVSPPVESTLATDTVSVESVNIFPTSIGGPETPMPELLVVALEPGSTPGQVNWPTDRTWDGRDIELISPSTNEVVHRTKIRTVRLEESLNPDAVVVSLLTPVDIESVGQGPFRYRVFDHAFYLPGDLLELRDARFLNSDTLWPIEVIGQRDAEESWFVDDWDARSTGPPRYVFRRGFWQPLRAPARPPEVSVGDPVQTDERWRGPEPPGMFSYCFTLTWGKLDQSQRHPGIGLLDEQNENYAVTDAIPNMTSLSRVTGYRNRIKPPRFESGPSPVAGPLTTTVASGTTWTGAVKIRLPSTEYAYGYNFYGFTDSTVIGDGTFLRTSSSMSGMHARIWRRRHTEDFENYDSLGTMSNKMLDAYSIRGLSRLDFDDSFYLLAEVPFPLGVNEGDHGVFVDTGEITPDYSVRLKPTNGYQGVRWHPQPDATYNIRARVLRRPDSLENDHDSPRLDPIAFDALIYKSLVYFFEHLKEYGAAERAEAKYQAELDSLRQVSGDLRPDHRVIYRRPARSPVHRGYGRKFWKRGDV